MGENPGAGWRARGVCFRAVAAPRPWIATSLRTAIAIIVLLLIAPPARADLQLDGRWRQGALREDFTVQQWLPNGCGPTPTSNTSGGGEIVAIRLEGDELAIVGGGRVYRSNQCYDQMPTLARETHSRDANGRTWRTRCYDAAERSAEGDPQHVGGRAERHAHRHDRDGSLRDRRRDGSLRRRREAHAARTISCPPRRLRHPRALRRRRLPSRKSPRPRPSRRLPSANFQAIRRGSRFGLRRSC